MSADTLWYNGFMNIVDEGELLGSIRIVKIETAPYYGTGKNSTWYIGECETCGKTRRIAQGHANRISSGTGTGCRCATRSTDYTSDLKHRYESYRRNAVSRNLEVEITYDEFAATTQLPCSYCGTEPEMRKSKAKRYEFWFPMSGVDRKDPQLGYYPDNITPCCTLCNRVKWDNDYETFIKHISKIYNYQRKK